MTKDIRKDNHSLFSSNFSINQIKNSYGVNKNVFKVSIDKKKYFIKFSDKKKNAKTKMVSKYLNIPKNHFYKQLGNKSLRIDQYIKGQLFTDIVLKEEKNKEFNKSIKLEKLKNKQLLDMYENTYTNIQYFEICNCQANKLFFQRLLGGRYQEYYENEYFKDLSIKTLIVNGKLYKSIEDTITNLKNKYLRINPQENVKVVLGHGDVHHQNILVREGENGSIYFIDHEYNSFIPINMEIAKPYYIDLLGNYFFFFNEILKSYIEVQNFEVSKKELRIDLKVKHLPKLRLALARNKVETFRQLLNQCNDPITLNEYLLLCHMLSRNPFDYAKDIFPIFLAYIPILNNFDVLDPEQLFKF